MSPRRYARTAPAVAVLLLCCTLVACQAREASRGRPPDVVLVVIDALRADRVRDALAGESGRALPNLARLAEDAVVYERASSPATWCAPAYGSLFTGRWPSFHGAERRVKAGEAELQPIDAEARTLAEVLRGRGMRTAAFLAGRDDIPRAAGFERGFDDYVDDGRLERPADLEAAVARWLDLRPGPIFLFVALDQLRQAKVRAGADDGVQRIARAELTNQLARQRLLTVERKAELAAGYDAELVEVDRALGHLLAVLQADGRYADSLIVVTADHGELLGEQGLVGHGWPPYEGALNVPLLVKYPQGRRAGERVERRVSTLGVYATVLDEVGAPLPDGVQARPLDDHHPVWAEDVDRQGRRLRAGYDGLRKKIIRITDGDKFDVACIYDMYNDVEERRPDCAGHESPLRGAMASFSSQPRPGQPASGLARAERTRDGHDVAPPGSATY